MTAHDIVVVGASAGGVEALTELVRGLPADLPAAVFVCLHVPPYSPSRLPAILSTKGQIPATHAVHGEAIVPGHIYVAPPDQHMLVQHGRVMLSHGPRENRSRPAIDPLFRSAAQAYGSRVVGVILSGALGDGAMGLAVIAAHGGVTVVQDPDEALFDSMPRTALQHTRVDDTLPVAQIAPLLVRLAREPKPMPEKGWQTMHDAEEKVSTFIHRDFKAQTHGRRAGETTVYTCPECGGTLWQSNDDGLIQFNCHVGHSYLAETLLSEMSEELEGALWACVRMLMEKATLTRQLATRLRDAGREAHAARVAEQADADDRHGQLIRDTLLETASSPGAETLAVEEVLEETS